MAYEKLKVENYNNVAGVQEKAAPSNLQPEQYLNLRNYGYERPGALTSRSGYESFAAIGFATFTAHPAGVFQYSQRYLSVPNDGIWATASLMVFDSGNILYGYSTTPYPVFTTLAPNVTTAAPIDYAFQNSRLFFANGFVFGTWNLSFSCFYSQPYPSGFVSTAAQSYGATFNLSLASSGITMTVPSGTFSFRIAYAKGFKNNKDSLVVGDKHPDETALADTILHVGRGATTVSDTGLWRLWGITWPPGFGISLLSVFTRFPGTSTWLQGPTLFGLQPGGFPNPLTDYVEFPYYTGDSGIENNAPFVSIAPRFIENYSNMMMLAGFSTQPNILWHSEIASPENVQPENFIEIRTDNGDQITALKNFQSSLIVFKNRSIHELTGYSPETLSLKDVTLEYGCVNNEAAVVFDNKLWFVDQKGICEYNGPNTFIVSYDVESTFKSLDTSKAKAIYLKQDNEVWFCFGNVALVYNTQISKWTIYDNIPIEFGKAASVLDLGVSILALSFLKAGTSHYKFMRFGESTFTDDGAAITLVAQSSFHKRLGDTTQELWRRFYLNMTPSLGVSITVNLRVNYGSSIVSTKNFVQNNFQERIDFGQSAKTLSVEWIMKANQKVIVNGYTIESRFLRSV